MVSSQEGRIFIVAFCSRLGAIALIIISDILFRDLDTSAHLQNFSCLPNASVDLPQSPLSPLAPWDSVYFVRIAKCGYENDMIHAFFPLLPILMRILDIPFYFFGRFLLPVYSTDIDSRYILYGLCINVVAFSSAAVFLHRLTETLLSRRNPTLYHKKLPLMSTLLFIFNPASLFYSVVYTESLFAACTFAGLSSVASFYYATDTRCVGSLWSLWLGIIALTAASATRSNGILSVGFLLHPFVTLVIRRRRRRRRGGGTFSSTLQDVSKRGETPREHRPASWRQSWKRFLLIHQSPRPLRPMDKTLQKGVFAQIALGCLCICLPSMGMQLYASASFCGWRGFMNFLFAPERKESISSHSEDDVPWCHRRPHSLYRFVQGKYWDVGFLRFYTKWERMANVLQSLPIVLLSGWICWKYWSFDWKRTWTLGCCSSSSSSSSGMRLSQTSHTSRQRKAATQTNPHTVEHSRRTKLVENDRLVPYVFHMAFMTCALLLFMHVNVGTRFLSSCPPLYWFLAEIVVRSHEPYGTLVWWWFFSFLGAGFLLWPNFYPWT